MRRKLLFFLLFFSLNLTSSEAVVYPKFADVDILGVNFLSYKDYPNPEIHYKGHQHYGHGQATLKIGSHHYCFDWRNGDGEGQVVSLLLRDKGCLSTPQEELKPIEYQKSLSRRYPQLKLHQTTRTDILKLLGLPTFVKKDQEYADVSSERFEYVLQVGEVAEEAARFEKSSPGACFHLSGHPRLIFFFNKEKLLVGLKQIGNVPDC